MKPGATPGFNFVGLSFQRASPVLATALPSQKEHTAMDQRLKDLASLVGELLAARWHKLQQEKKDARQKTEGQAESGNARRPTVVEPG